ncbi:hypothetical protein HanIR_Chr04g0171231 [Helianthus annuus]|nr:hypothetical protein HanIR_Chr04g0171231 [Helianthus annuus]
MKHWLTLRLTSWFVSCVGFNLLLHSPTNGFLENRTPVTRHKEENRGVLLVTTLRRENKYRSKEKIVCAIGEMWREQNVKPEREVSYL